MKTILYLSFSYLSTNKNLTFHKQALQANVAAQNTKSCTTFFINNMNCPHIEDDIVIRTQSAVSLY